MHPEFFLPGALPGQGGSPIDQGAQTDPTYKITPGSGPKDTSAASAADNNKIKTLEARIKELEAQAKKVVSPAPANPEKEKEPIDEDRTLQKSLQKQFQDLKNMEPTLRDALCEGKGGYASFLASLENQLQLAFQRQRQSKPLAQQKASIEALLKRKQKAKDEADADLRKLQRQRDDLDSKIAEQQQKLTEADSCLAKIKADAVAIAEKAAAELRAETLNVQPDDSSVTAAAVLGYMQKLPAVVTEHPEGKHAMDQVMAFLNKLHSAAQVVRPPTGPEDGQAAAGANEEMAVDDSDDLFTALAEAAVPPIDTGADADAQEARRISVADAKARMASQTGTLSGLNKVRKVAAKK